MYVKYKINIPSVYWSPKMHRKLISALLIIVSKKYSTDFSLKAFYKAFKLIYHQIQSFDDKITFLLSIKTILGYREFKVHTWRTGKIKWIQLFEAISRLFQAKAISTFDFSTSFTKLPHFDLNCTLNKEW